MATSINAQVGFALRDEDAATGRELAVPGYPDNRVALTECVVRNARAFDTSLDREGFVLANHRSAYSDVLDRKRLAVDYHREMEVFLKDYLGAVSVEASPANTLLVRYGEWLVGRRKHDGPGDIIDDRIPASFTHVDFLPEVTSRYAAAMKDLGHNRMMLVQTWRAVSEPPQDVPLALCDRRTLSEQDLSRSKGILSPENAVGMAPAFHIGKIHYSDAQKWYYYPNLTADEVIIFSGFDTASPDGWRVGHGAFDNRTLDPDAKPRISVEARFVAYF